MKKQIIDQSLHFGLAVTWFFLFVLPLKWWAATAAVLFFAVLRELDQHGWEWKRMSWFDLSFFSLGAAVAALAWRFV